MRMLGPIAMASLVALGACAHGQPQGQGQGQVRVPAVGTITDRVDVIVNEEGKITSPVEKLRQLRGRDVTWNVKNMSAKQVTVKIDGFRAADAYKHLVEPRDKDPFTPGCVREITVGSGKAASRKCTIKPTAIEQRTYKYDILEVVAGQKDAMLLDPEMEIP